jgi:hypothetical protein
VKKLIVDLLKIRAPKTVEVTHAVISGIYTEANELGYTDVNPAHGLSNGFYRPKRSGFGASPTPSPGKT